MLLAVLYDGSHRVCHLLFQGHGLSELRHRGVVTASIHPPADHFPV
jgi:hypothetical protein